MNPILQQLQAEAGRRFNGQPASNVALNQNPSASQSVNPLSTMGGGETQNPLQGQTGALKTAMPNEAQFILKALVKRLNDNAPENPKPQTTAI